MTRGGRWKVAAGVLAACALVPGVRFARVAWIEWASFAAPRLAVDTAAARARVPALRAVSWLGHAGVVHGWFVAGSVPAGVVLLHGSQGSRAELLPEVEMLAARGFSVLAFDWPGHGESAGAVTWDETERATLQGAVDWLAARPEVANGRIGAFGFSMGGYLLVQQAVGDPRVRAVAVAGTPGDAVAAARWQYRALGPAPHWPARLAMRARGMRPDRDVPERIVRALAPRPLLVVVGERDEVVPPALTRALHDAAAEPKALLSIPGAAHGDYARAAPQTYADRLTSFFAHALLDDRIAGGPSVP